MHALHFLGCFLDVQSNGGKKDMSIHSAIKEYKNRVIKSGINNWYSIKLSHPSKKWYMNSNKIANPAIIVSVTSFPARIDRIHYSLKSILAQKMKPDKIVVYLGDKEFEGIELPESLTELFQYGVEVRFRKDLKPHTKYLYAMQDFPDDIILTVDDDIYYRPNLIRDLYSAYTQHPDCVTCTRAHKMTMTSGRLDGYNSWDFETKDTKEPSHYLFATGVGGVLYPPHLLIPETFNIENIEKLTLKNDDVWLKFMEILSGVKVFAIPSNRTKYVVGVQGSEKITLNSSNVLQNMNDVYIKNVMDAYHISLSDFEK